MNLMLSPVLRPVLVGAAALLGGCTYTVYPGSSAAPGSSGRDAYGYVADRDDEPVPVSTGKPLPSSPAPDPAPEPPVVEPEPTTPAPTEPTRTKPEREPVRTADPTPEREPVPPRRVDEGKMPKSKTIWTRAERQRNEDAAAKKAREVAAKKAREAAAKKAREDAAKKAREDAAKKAREDAAKKATFSRGVVNEATFSRDAVQRARAPKRTQAPAR